MQTQKRYVKDKKLVILNTLSHFSENISPNYSREKRISLAKSRAAFYVPSVMIKSFRHIIRRNYASSENLDLTSAVEETKLVLANLWSVRGEIYAFRILFPPPPPPRVCDIQAERVDKGRGRDAVISQVRAPASRFSDRAGRRSSREIPSPRGTLPVFCICIRGVLAKQGHLNRPPRYAPSGTRAAWLARPPSFPLVRVRGLSMTRWFAGVGNPDRRSCSNVQRRSREWWVKTGPSRSPGICCASPPWKWVYHVLWKKK